VDFASICEACHNVVHIGRSLAHGKRSEALIHLCKVNGISTANAENLVSSALHAWQQRSRKKWKVVVRPGLLKAYPQLAVLET
jgi:hypothetical protein